MKQQWHSCCVIRSCVHMWFCTCNRSRSRSYSPSYERKASRRYRSRSRSPYRQSSPPRRGSRRSPPRRGDRRPSPPRRSSETRRLLRRSEDIQWPTKRTRDSRSSSESDSSPQRMSEMLAKKLLGTSGLKDLQVITVMLWGKNCAAANIYWKLFALLK